MRSLTKFVFTVCVIFAAGMIKTSTTHAQSVSPDKSSGAHFAVPIGKIETLVGVVRIKHPAGAPIQVSVSPDAVVKVGDAVYQGDQVTTEANSKVGIAFTDGTAFNLSSNAHMVLDKYIYDPNGKSNASLFSLSKGAFTFIAGKVARTGDMRVNTPVATMGIRGTAPHVEISKDGKVKFTTLIEKDKNKMSAGSKRARRNRASLQTPTKLVQTNQKDMPTNADREFDRHLKICEGC